MEEIIELKNDDSRDWWTKYFASVENAIIEVCTRQIILGKVTIHLLKLFVYIAGKSKDGLRRHQWIITDSNGTRPDGRETTEKKYQGIAFRSEIESEKISEKERGH